MKFKHNKATHITGDVSVTSSNAATSRSDPKLEARVAALEAQLASLKHELAKALGWTWTGE